jgi:hypothetical protein
MDGAAGEACQSELSALTGRHKRTVKRALDRMCKLVDVTTGEVIRMVVKADDTWHALKVDLDYIANLVGTAGFGKQQVAKHRQERCIHRRALARFKQRK